MDPSAFQVIAPEAGDPEAKPHALVRFPYDRELVRRFREAFPRARWREGEGKDEGRWRVPGARAAQRVEAWISRELAALDRHADAKGRDALLFDPMPASPYLAAGEDGLVVRTP